MLLLLKSGILKLWNKVNKDQRILKLWNKVNKDHVLDTHGRRLLLLCQTSDLIIANGRTLDDCNIGQHTFVCKKGMSVVDYLLASPDDITFLSHFKILDFNEFSDHAPVFFAFLSQNPSKENKHSNVTHFFSEVFN